eukprot:TRINITY_DN2022_c1_g1_i1.p1 TRINITY_DN2022_c1_g1~~TRINITY_DN2022_c1_g1_i1.p1  ORF type:complete len:461 (+),score=171.16 TRINITY_DN2022_c1_g1_i1:97-1479(+)
MQARSVQCYLLLLARLFQQAMRNALAPLLVFMTREMPINTTQKGNLLSAVAAGYFLTQVPGGALADRVGAKNVITGAMALSALCCLLLPTAADYGGVPSMWLCIAAMGAVQGPLFPTSTVFLSRWLPRKTDEGPDEKAWGTSQLDIGISVGALLIVPIANILAEAVGWRAAYRCIGGATLGYVALWVALGADEPNKCSFISERELRYLERAVPQVKAPPGPARSPSLTASGAPPPEQRPAAAAAAEGGWIGMPARLLIHPAIWAIFAPHMAFNFGAYFMTNWNPTYYADVLRMDPSEAKYHLAVPHVMNLVSKSLNPAMVSLVERRGYSLLRSRQIFTVLGLLGAALAMLPIPHLRQAGPWTTTLLFAAANTCFGLAPSGFKSNYLDVTVRYVGVISGIGNTLGTVGSYVGPITVGFIIDLYGSWELVMAVIGAANVIGALAFLRYAQVTPIDDDTDKVE